MEPFILTAAIFSQFQTTTFIETIIQGIIGNRADTIFSKSPKYIYQKLSNGINQTDNHEVQKAVRRSILKATIIAVDHAMESYKLLDDFYSNNPADLREIRKYLRKEIKVLNEKEIKFPNQEEYPNFEQILSPQLGDKGPRVDYNVSKLQESIIYELEKRRLRIEIKLKKIIQTGWNKGKHTVKWFEVAMAFFSEELKTNPRLSTIIQVTYLKNITSDIENIQLTITEIKDSIEVYYKLHSDLISRFNEILDSLDRIEGQIEILPSATAEKVIEGIKEKFFISPEKKSNSLEKNFRSYLGSDLKAEYLLGKRAMKRYGYKDEIYVERKQVDEKLRSNIRKKINTIIWGRSLAGKSRAIFHNIKNYEQDSLVYILNDSLKLNHNILAEFQSLTINPDSNVFFIINDIDEYLEYPLFEQVLDELLLSDNITVVATCKKSKFHLLENFMGLFLDYFRIIKIPPIDESIKKEILLHIGVLDSDQIIDETIGSFFLKLDYMRRKYKSLTIHGKEILRSYKCTDIYLGKNKGNINLIKDYTKKRLQIYHRSTDWDISDSLFDEILEILKRESFIVSHDDERNVIKVEDAYLSRIIAKDESETKIVREIMEYYPEREIYTKLISRVSSVELSNKVFSKLREKNILPDVITFNAIISREKHFNKAKEKFNALLQSEEDFQPDHITLNTLISKANDFQSALSGYNLFDEFERINPDEVTYFTLIGKMRKASFDEILIVKEDFEKRTTQNVKSQASIPLAFYNLLIQKSRSSDLSFKYYLELQQYYQPSEATIMCALSNSKGYADVLLILLDARQYKVIIDEKFINSSSSKINEFKELFGYCNLLLHYNYVLPEYTVKLLLDLADNFDHALSVYRDLPKEQITLGTIVFNALIRQAKTYEDGSLGLQMMQNAGIQPTKNTYNSLMRTGNREQALAIFEDVFSSDYSPDTYTFYSLISLSINFKEAEGYYWEAINSGLKSKIDLPLFNILFKQARNESDSRRCFDILKKNDLIRPNSTTIWLMINKSRTFEISLEMLEYAINNGFKISTTIINTILKSTKTEEQAKILFEKMHKLGLRPSLKNFSLRIKVCKTIERAWIVYNDLIKAGYKPDAITFSILITHAKHRHEAQEVFEEFINIDAIRSTNQKRDKGAFDSFLTKYFSKVKKFDICLNAYNRYRKAGGPASIKSLNNILKHKRYNNELELILEVIEAEGLVYDRYTYFYILDRAKSVYEAWDIIQEMESKNLIPDTRCANTFIKKAKGYDEAYNWFTFIFARFNLQPDKYTLFFFSKIVGNSRDYIRDIANFYEIPLDNYIEKIIKEENISFKDKALTWLIKGIKNQEGR